MQEEVNQKTIALAVSTSKMTGRVLLAAIREYQRQRQQSRPKMYKGRQTIKQLMKQNAALSNIEITDKNINSFEHTAKKYGIDYALKKDNSETPPHYLVFFKGRDVDVINMAFSEYAAKQLNQQNKPSLRQALKKMIELAKSQNKQRAKVKEKDRSVEL